MALTKVTGQVVKTDTDLTVGVITAVTATFTGNVSVAGTLTYDDVTNVDSVGLITARSGIDITGGGGLNLTGGAGVVTATTYRVGTASTLDASGLSVSAGVVTTTTLRVGSGSTAAPSITPTDDTNTGIFFPSADTIAFGEGGVEAARIDSSGRFGLGTSSPSNDLDVLKTAAGSTTTARIGATATTGANNATLILNNGGGGNATLRFDYESSTNRASIGVLSSDQKLTFGTAGSTAMTIDASQRVGIGTTSPGDLLTLNSTVGYPLATFNDSGTFRGQIGYTFDYGYFHVTSASTLGFRANGSERARIDSSGRLLVGTSSSPSSGDGAVARIFVLGYTGNASGAGYMTLARGEAASSITADEEIGNLNFSDSAGNNFAGIRCYADAGAGSNDYPGRLSFSTTADGASSPTERVRISNSGDFICPSIYNNSVANAANVYVGANGQLYRSTSSIKYKTDIETLQDSYADAILGCRPVWYRSTSSGDNPNHGFWGFIAEEVAAVDPRLVQWKTAQISYDEKGSAVETQLDTPEPDGVQYDRFVPHLLNLIKRQKEQIEAQSTAIAALEARLSALETQ